jgi:transposase
MGVEQAQICLEATGHYGRDLALALHDAGHVVSIVNPAQIRHFARTKLGRNKTDKIDAALIREYAEMFKPAPWSPPSPAMRRLGELQTIRAGLVGSLTEWKNRQGSGLTDPVAHTLAEVTIRHLTAQLAAVDKAIAETIDQDSDLRRKRDLLLSISGVGEILSGLLLAEMPGPEVLRRGSEVTAYAGLNPSHHQSGKSIDRPSRISKIGNAVLRSALYMPALAALRSNPAVAALAQRLKQQGRLTPRQIVVAAMRKLLVLCFGVLKSGQPFDPKVAMPTGSAAA